MQNVRLCAFADEADSALAGQIRAMRENGISLLEMRGIDGKNVTTLTTERARQVKKELSATGIDVWSIGSPAGKSDIHADFAAEEEQFKRLLETADIMQAKCIRLFSFYKTEGAPAYKDEVLLRLSRFVELAKGSGVVLCHENEKGIWGDSPERCAEILTALPEIKAVFDPANFVQCGVDVLQAWRLLAPYVYYGHIKDADTEGTVVPPGMGLGRIEEYLPDFFARGNEVLTLEPHLTRFVGRGGLEGSHSKLFDGCDFADGRAAFDYAVNALKGILQKINVGV